MSRAAGFNPQPLFTGRSGDPAERGPTSDSYKMPLVLLSLDSADALDLPRSSGPSGVYANFNGFGLNVLELFRTPALLNEQDDQEFRLNAWETIESFEYSFEQGAAWVARFTVFDPTFEAVLPRIITARANAQRVLAYFKFGWMVDGPLRFGNMSRAKSGIVVNIEPEFLQDGVRVTFDVQSPEMFVKTVEKASAAWRSGTPADEIAKQALEMSHPTTSELNRKIPTPIVRTPVPCEPVENSGNPIEMRDISPVTFVRETVTRMAVAKDKALQDRKFSLFQSDREPGVLVFAPEGWKDDAQGVPIKRTYNVGRGQSAQLISFKPGDYPSVANQLGGVGRLSGVDSANKTQSTVSAGPVTSNPADNKTTVVGESGSERIESTPAADASTATTADSTRFSHMTFARDLATAVQERKVQWATAQALATQADAELVGDPHIHINDYLEFRTYVGGTISTAGRDDASQSPQLLKLISGQYIVVGYRHTIGNGSYVTSVKLARAVQQDMAPDEDDPAYTSDTYTTRDADSSGLPVRVQNGVTIT